MKRGENGGTVNTSSYMLGIILMRQCFEKILGLNNENKIIIYKFKFQLRESNAEDMERQSAHRLARCAKDLDLITFDF